ncbi:hypothetical protein H0H93_006755 [Arthromyces matolae]|nr:hypothetical protein H0H93_006755 [Arthromyces matolae]
MRSYHTLLVFLLVGPSLLVTQATPLFGRKSKDPYPSAAANLKGDGSSSMLTLYAQKSEEENRKILKKDVERCMRYALLVFGSRAKAGRCMKKAEKECKDVEHETRQKYEEEKRKADLRGDNDIDPLQDSNVAANGLFLLSQAHQELEKRQQDAQRQAVAPAATASASTRRGTKRSSTAAEQPTNGNARGKRSRAAANSRRRSTSEDNEEMDEEDEDDDDDDDGVNGDVRGGSRRLQKKPETEEEKRRNFLERNRQAALKCRQRKKAWLAQLQARNEQLTSENERLTSALVASREEISRLSALVGGAGIVGGPGVVGVGPGQPQHGQGQGQGQPPVPMGVGLKRGYGY